MLTFNKNPFEVDINAIGDAAHREFLLQRRRRLAGWLDRIEALPPLGENAHNGQICYCRPLREELVRLDKRLHNYASRQHRRPFNVFLLAPPGSGKSTLVKSIRIAIESKCVPDNPDENTINLSNIQTPSDMFSWLRKRCKDHETSPSSHPRVMFFDEIDVPEWSAYQFMLTPMWDAKFVLGEENVSVPPSVFIFAGSPRIEDGRGDAAHGNRPRYAVYESIDEWIVESRHSMEQWLRQKAPDKAPDFFSRIDTIIRIPPAYCHFLRDDTSQDSPYWQDEETVQIAASIIKRQYSGVTSIDRRVLVYLGGALLPARRELDRIFFLSSNPAEPGVFGLEDLPTDLLEGGHWYEEVAKHPNRRINL